MAEEFNTDGMLDMYLFENEQLLEQLQEIVLEQTDAGCFDEDSINSEPCIPLKDPPVS